MFSSPPQPFHRLTGTPGVWVALANFHSTEVMEPEMMLPYKCGGQVRAKFSRHNYTHAPLWPNPDCHKLLHQSMSVFDLLLAFSKFLCQFRRPCLLSPSISFLTLAARQLDLSSSLKATLSASGDSDLVGPGKTPDCALFYSSPGDASAQKKVFNPCL